MVYLVDMIYRFLRRQRRKEKLESCVESHKAPCILFVYTFGVRTSRFGERSSTDSFQNSCPLGAWFSNLYSVFITITISCRNSGWIITISS